MGVPLIKAIINDGVHNRAGMSSTHDGIVTAGEQARGLTSGRRGAPPPAAAFPRPVGIGAILRGDDADSSTCSARHLPVSFTFCHAGGVITCHRRSRERRVPNEGDFIR